MSYPVLAIANKLLASATDYDGGELMSNMKLQKMLYYQQGYHLAAFGTPLFDEDIEAWMYGPVVPCVYDHFKKFGAGGIEPERINLSCYRTRKNRSFKMCLPPILIFQP